MWTKLDQINVAIYSVIDRSNLGSVGSVSNLWEGILTTEKVARAFIARIDREEREGYSE
jgi:hypothetical protein